MFPFMMVGWNGWGLATRVGRLKPRLYVAATESARAYADNRRRMLGTHCCERGGVICNTPELRSSPGARTRAKSGPSAPGAGLPTKVHALGTFVVRDPEYHRRQAMTLLRLARTTRDPQTSAALKQSAAEHSAIAEEQEDQLAARAFRKPDRD
jgi:hypothetical protein